MGDHNLQIRDFREGTSGWPDARLLQPSPLRVPQVDLSSGKTKHGGRRSSVGIVGRTELGPRQPGQSQARGVDGEG
jgi:hypothetical protein